MRLIQREAGWIVEGASTHEMRILKREFSRELIA
jgi:hypothetical protein